MLLQMASSVVPFNWASEALSRRKVVIHFYSSISYCWDIVLH